MDPSEVDSVYVSDFELRQAGMRVDPVSALAWSLLNTHPLMAAKEDGEDSCGRSRHALQPARETVDRCFELAQLWYDRAREASPGLVPTRSELAHSDGRLKRAMHREEFLGEKLPKTT